MTTRAASTSLQRTYRYLRIAIAGTVVVIFVSIAVTIPRVGVLPSISHYFYTPAQTPFVGALIAAAVCFLALSGRGAERVLLDIAALFVPLIAIVPTAISFGSIKGVRAVCLGSCVPKSFAADVDVGVATYLIVAVVIVAVSGVLVLAGQVERGGGGLSLAIAFVVLVTVWLTWWLARPAFLQWAHFLSAIGFFGIIAAVAVVNVIRPVGTPPTRWLKVSYIVIAAVMVLDVISLPLLSRVRFENVYWVFIGEAVALVAFAAFWVLQSIQNWNDDDPAALSGNSP